MIKYKAKMVETKTVEEITCDICKEVYNIENQDDVIEMQEFHHINFTGGFGSVFGDGEEVTADICQYCLKQMIGKYLEN